MPVKSSFHKLFRIGEPGRLPDDPVPLLRLGFFIIVVFICRSYTFNLIVIIPFTA